MAKVRIMIVEDEVFTADEEEQQILGLGYEVVAKVSTGEDAIRLAGELKPDVVLMDIQLGGGMDGSEAAQSITKKYGTPIIYVTAFADKATVEKARLSQPFGYIVKPFTPQALQSNIEIALYKSDMEQQLKNALDMAKRFNKLAETREFRIKELRDELEKVKSEKK